ncbi:transcription factor MBP1, partial [Magnaporthiopsis poae ATCC 64411]
MVKAAAAVSTPAGPGIYSATYSGIPVYEYQFGVDLKEHVMRRRHDDWINATHILKAAGFDKPARTRILEREVQKDTHEKIQGGYGKYQGTWIPLESGEALANRNNVYDRLRPIFEYVPGAESPPPAPRHASKPKQPKKPAVPKFNSKAARAAAASQPTSQPVPYSAAPTPQDGFDNGDVLMEDDGTPDNLTVASASYLAEEDRQDLSHFSTGHRKRKREELLQDLTDQQHSVYGDELLDYFLLSRNERPAIRPDPPTNFQPDWAIDMDRHTAIHWAAAMGDVEIIKQLKRFGARLDVQNVRGETPLMRAVNFTNCYEKQTFPAVMKELFETVDHRDLAGCTVIHHAAIMKSGRVSSPSCSRYYLDNILNRLQETHGPDFVQQLLDAQDVDGNTAVHLAAQRGASKCIRALLGRGASTDVANNEGIRAEDLIRELNASKKARSAPQRSSSPFAPESQRHVSFRDALGVDAAGEGAAAGTTGSTGSTAHHGPHGPVGQQACPCRTSQRRALTVQIRITPLVFEKFHELARSYEDEWRQKDEAEREAARILSNAQAELDAARAQAAEIEAMLQPELAA